MPTRQITRQGDGNLVLSEGFSQPWAYVWDTPGAVGGAVKAVMDENGNFRVDSAIDWSTQTGANENVGAYLVVQNDGNIVVYHLDGRVLWSRY